MLAEYVIALLKHDGDREAVRKLCEEEIPDFLTEGMLHFRASKMALGLAQLTRA